MILYTLLTTHTERDMTNIILTACIVYYIGYSISSGFVSDEYNYMCVGAIAMLDLYLSNGILQGTTPLSKASKASKASKSKPKASKQKASKASKHKRRVTFNPYPTVHTIPARPRPGMNPGMMPVPPRYMPMQPGQQQYPQHQQQHPQMPMIDNRGIADEIESNDSESSIESIAVSDTISWSSEEY